MARETGQAGVEQAGLIVLIAALVLASVAVVTGREQGSEQRELGSLLSRKIRCAAVGPGPCWRDPLTGAYGRTLAGWVRASAPVPGAIVGAEGLSISPVDFRRCRSASCAVADPARPGLTTSNRRLTLFVSVADRRRSGGGVRANYWAYRPGLGWELSSRSSDSAGVAALATTPLLESDIPVLVALETLAGRNHIAFRPGEEPPWRWSVEGR